MACRQCEKAHYEKSTKNSLARTHSASLEPTTTTTGTTSPPIISNNSKTSKQTYYTGTMSKSSIPGHVIRFFFSTVPFLVVLVFLLYKAWERPHLAAQAASSYNANNANNNNNANVDIDDGGVFSLMDILLIFLMFHICWTLFVIYLLIFVPKRRHFLGRYLSEDAERSLGDVIYDPDSRACGHLHDYGYTLYAHPTQPAKVVRKRVRVYQAYTRERVTIVRLPNRPLSGQSKIDIEIDLKQMREERDISLRWISWVGLFWVIFTLVGASYDLYQMHVVESHGDLMTFNENTELAVRLFIVVIGLNIPVCYAVNWIRFLFYHNWMVNRGALINDENEARKVDPICFKALSEDGSEEIPYSILHAESMSYQGTLPSYHHQAAPPGGPQPLLHDNARGNNQSIASHRSFRPTVSSSSSMMKKSAARTFT
jgi:hypothetical protein